MTHSQKPGEKPQRPGPYAPVNPSGKPAGAPERPIHMPPGVKPLPPTQRPGDKWQPARKVGPGPINGSPPPPEGGRYLDPMQAITAAGYRHGVRHAQEAGQRSQRASGSLELLGAKPVAWPWAGGVRPTRVK